MPTSPGAARPARRLARLAEGGPEVIAPGVGVGDAGRFGQVVAPVLSSAQVAAHPSPVVQRRGQCRDHTRRAGLDAFARLGRRQDRQVDPGVAEGIGVGASVTEPSGSSALALRMSTSLASSFWSFSRPRSASVTSPDQRGHAASRRRVGGVGEQRLDRVGRIPRGDAIGPGRRRPARLPRRAPRPRPGRALNRAARSCRCRAR